MTSSFDVSARAKEREVKMLLITTGVLSAAHLPFWLNWLEVNRPQYSTTVAMTETAAEFVSVTALEAITGRPVVRNTWSDGAVLRATHTIVAAGYDGVIVFPASTDFMSKLASASGATPLHLALLGVKCPIVLSPSYPPNVEQHPLVVDVRTRLGRINGVRIVETRAGKSRSTGEELGVAAPLWEAVTALEDALDIEAQGKGAAIAEPAQA